LTDFDEIWHGDANRGQTVKILNFSKKNKMAAVAIFKKTKIAILQQRIELTDLREIWHDYA